MRVKISISAEDIRQGDRGDCTRCALARAAQRALPGYEVSVYPNALYLHGVIEGVFHCLEVLLPWPARTFVYGFDAGENVQPLAFTVEIAPLETCHAQPV